MERPDFYNNRRKCKVGDFVLQKSIFSKKWRAIAHTVLREFVALILVYIILKTFLLKYQVLLVQPQHLSQYCLLHEQTHIKTCLDLVLSIQGSWWTRAIHLQEPY